MTITANSHAATRGTVRPPSDPRFKHLDRTIIAAEQTTGPRRWAWRMRKRLIEARGVPAFYPAKGAR